MLGLRFTGDDARAGVCDIHRPGPRRRTAISAARRANDRCRMDADATRSQLAAALARVAGGDRSALRIVYQDTSAKLFGVCLRILNDRSEAEDVLQDVFVTGWRKAASFDAARASPITWLVAIARRCGSSIRIPRRSFLASAFVY